MLVGGAAMCQLHVVEEDDAFPKLVYPASHFFERESTFFGEVGGQHILTVFEELAERRERQAEKGRFAGRIESSGRRSRLPKRSNGLRGACHEQVAVLVGESWL